MKRVGIIVISVALATGLTTTCWAAEGAGGGPAGSASGTSTIGSGSGMNNGGMNSNGSGMKPTTGENKGLPGGHSGDDLNKPGNGDHGNNGGNGG
jgi:hypothetical protein